MRYYADLLFQYVMKKKWLYYFVGLGAFSLLYIEARTPEIPKEALPDYIKIAKENGEFFKILTGYSVAVFGSGPNYYIITILTIIILYCIYAEIRINMPSTSGGKTILNKFSGWFQINNQTNHYGKDE